MNENINILNCVNDPGVNTLLNLYNSLVNNNLEENFSFYVVDNDLSSESKTKIETFLTPYNNAQVEFITHNRCLPDSLSQSYRIPKTAYYRILVGDLFADKDVHRVLYLDSDLINTGQIRSLYDQDLDQFVIGAVEDAGYLRRFDKMHLEEALDYRYFNSGVLLIDVDRWRQQDIGNKVLQFAQDHADICRYHDQDALNAILFDKWKYLHPRFNAQTNIMRDKMKPTDDYQKEMYASAKNDPVLIHYCGHVKPWHDDFPACPMKDIYEDHQVEVNDLVLE